METAIKKKPKSVFVEGPIAPSFLANSIEKHATKTSIGAHELFLGQVREDEHESSEAPRNSGAKGGDGAHTIAIEYSAYEEMANKEFHRIREEAFDKFELTCMHIWHSLGRVNVGELGFVVFVSSAHREAAFDATRWIVEEVKNKVPIFGKELLSDGTDLVKTNESMGQ